MRYTKEQQLLALDYNAGKLYQRMLNEIRDNQGIITAVARQRLELGFELYGSLMWEWDLPTLRENRIEEYADGLNYWLPEVRIR